MSKEELRDWYIKTIGYDPFKEDSNITVEDVEKIKEEYEDYADGIMEEVGGITEIEIEE